MSAVYLWREGGNCARKYERRITICSASDLDSAEETLVSEAKEYSTDSIEYLDHYYISEIDEPPGSTPVEVSSELSMGIYPKSGGNIEPETFIEKYWQFSRIEDCEAIGINHSWHNKDGEHSACHNCKVIRRGRLWEE